MVYGEGILRKAKEYYDIYANGGKIGKFIVPTMEGYALYMSINTDTIYEWLKDTKKKEFSEITRMLQNLRAQMLQNEGLLGTWNSNITKLLLSKHGYSEKTEQEINLKTPEPILVKFIDGKHN
jgi:hypothetical protein